MFGFSTAEFPASTSIPPARITAIAAIPWESFDSHLSILAFTRAAAVAPPLVPEVGRDEEGHW
jgi:hypothetical protein